MFGKPFTDKRIRDIYTDPTTQQLQLDDNGIKRHISLNAEMNIYWPG